MNYLALTGLINLVTSICLGLFVLLQKERTHKHGYFFILSFSISIYSLGYFFWQNTTDLLSSVRWFYLLFEGIILINLLYLIFVFSIIDEIKKRRNEIILHLCLAVIFSFLNLTNQLYVGFEPRFNLGFWPKPTELFNVFLLVWFYQCFYGFFLLLRQVRVSSGIVREQVKYFLIAAVFGLFGGATNWPMWFGYNFPPYCNIFISIYVGIVSYAIVRFRLVDVRVAVVSSVLFVFV